ncbi:cell division protein DedD [Shimwellia blattae]|uniref:Cell division protein DedD n=1 Tax=Shimwellia blattae (strain ATCC 29907 / DSM 4481 / JCM 1650 / NBRC 105725 / CDC 9005-74) TaxID=630626 RepID=I2B732_SHIBC|nr:cell division protein DedD [Shimwellia blattae]AFJ46336.1 DedD protein [Shimwellia blattae DSM 4481 = NBRC 105725]GAB79919.1 DedD protein [Shimwellia blattae DSM 4481 = NBRC 105725]VDY63802.1 cell division protein DedD [Shimwellia blattae]VEC21940.1 cell division protein DedD [Shimwellia blattae]
MASKFQNRLVGTIVLVALGVIILPGLLDGQKKHYQDEFAAIPLVPRPGDTDEPDMLPVATQALPAQPPEGAAEEVRASTAGNPALRASALPVDSGAGLDEVSPVAREMAKPQPPQPKPQPKPKPQPQPVKTPDQAAERLAVASEQAAPPAAKAPQEQSSAPVGKAYVVQLGALKNADKVNEIVAKLRAAGFKAYTSPSTPVQGKITRILVGPEANKDKLKGSLGQLQQLSGLSGVVMSYSVR